VQLVVQEIEVSEVWGLDSKTRR